MYGDAYMTILHVPTASTQMKIAKLKRFSKVESFHIIVRILVIIQWRIACDKTWLSNSLNIL